MSITSLLKHLIRILYRPFVVWGPFLHEGYESGHLRGMYQEIEERLNLLH
jgi:hypothetical protein